MGTKISKESPEVSEFSRKLNAQAPLTSSTSVRISLKALL